MLDQSPQRFPLTPTTNPAPVQPRSIGLNLRGTRARRPSCAPTVGVFGQYVGTVIVATTILCLGPACDYGISLQQLKDGGYVAQVPPDAANLSHKPLSDGETTNTISLEYSFGLVRPGSSNIHRFLVKNDEATAWTLKKLHVSCACTSPSVSSTVIEPGSSETFDVQYRARSTPGDDSQIVLVEFNEATAPLVQLRLTAVVRSPLTVQPSSQVYLGRVVRGVTVRADVQIENYSESDWDAVEATSPWPWASIAIVGPSRELMPLAPRQRWRAVIRGIPTGLEGGENIGQLEVHAKGFPEFQANVPIHIEVVEPVKAIPSAVFIGSVSPGEKSSRILTVRFAEGAVPSAVEEVSLSPDAPERLSLGWQRTSGQFWEMSVVVFAPREHGQFSGEFDVGFANPDLGVLRIPYRGFVE